MLLGTRMRATVALSVLPTSAAAADQLDGVKARGKLMVFRDCTGLTWPS